MLGGPVGWADAAATATDSASLLSRQDGPGIQNVEPDAPVIRSVGQDAPGTDSRRHYDAPRAVRHSARFGRSFLALIDDSD